MLREGVELEGKSINLDGLTDPDCTNIEGIPNSEVLLKLANAFMSKDKAALATARDALVEEMGEEALVDAMGVASIFQRMDRIADATGIPSDGPVAMMQEDLAKLLGTDQYVSAGNTKPMSWIKRTMIKLVAIPQIKKMIREKSGK